jgi:hypothetical protein
MELFVLAGLWVLVFVSALVANLLIWWAIDARSLLRTQRP